MKWIFLSDWPKTYQEFPLYSLHSQEYFWSTGALKDFRGQDVLPARREGNEHEEVGMQTCSHSVCVHLRFSERAHLRSRGNKNLSSWIWACHLHQSKWDATSWSKVMRQCYWFALQYHVWDFFPHEFHFCLSVKLLLIMFFYISDFIFY